MVFDWFKRQPAEPEPADAPGDAPIPEEEGNAAAEQASDALGESQTAQAPSPEPATPAPASTDPSPAPAPAAAVGGAIDADALAWAREAYARLKAEQAARQAETVAPAPQPPPAAPSPPPPSSPSLQEVEPPPQVAPPPLEEPAPLEPVSANDGAPVPPQPAITAPPEAASMSLLERAAAERRQRQQELLEVAGPEPTAPAVEPTPPVAAPVADEAEPTLGNFDEAFTWSAEVLAAQGRRVDQVSLEEIDWLARLRRGMEKTRKGFVSQLLERLGDDPLTPELVDDLETTLLRADVGVQATDQVLDALRDRLNLEAVDGSEGLRFLKEQLRELLEAPIAASGRELLAPERDRLNIWLMVGVNGVGKTTTLGKLANLAVRSGYSCLIAAADTFRAAAVDQVRIWGERSGVPVISNPSANADPAAVVYDAISSAKAKGTELVLVDTAGRLQTKHNLMEELSKVRRIVDKLAPEAVVESLLVLDSTQGQNGLRQAMAFAEAAGLTGVVITKLDGSSRGGVALAVCREVGLPIRFIGAGEGLRDLRPFNSFEFVEALLAT
jgi:fused signal recognition particle receptor